MGIERSKPKLREQQPSHQSNDNEFQTLKEFQMQISLDNQFSERSLRYPTVKNRFGLGICCPGEFIQNLRTQELSLEQLRANGSLGGLEKAPPVLGKAAIGQGSARLVRRLRRRGVRVAQLGIGDGVEKIEENGDNASEIGQRK
jgi:hypothetical protein